MPSASSQELLVRYGDSTPSFKTYVKNKPPALTIPCKCPGCIRHERFKRPQSPCNSEALQAAYTGCATMSELLGWELSEALIFLIVLLRKCCTRRTINLSIQTTETAGVNTLDVDVHCGAEYHTQSKKPEMRFNLTHRGYTHTFVFDEKLGYTISCHLQFCNPMTQYQMMRALCNM